MPGRSAICMFQITARSISCWASCRAERVNSCELWALSHMGEWRLKSPSHISSGLGASVVRWSDSDVRW